MTTLITCLINWISLVEGIQVISPSQNTHEIEDLSERCTNNYHEEFILSSNMGISDSVSLLLAHPNKSLSCALTFSTHLKSELDLLITVVIFADAEEGYKPACANNIRITGISHEGKAYDVCQRINNKYQYPRDNSIRIDTILSIKSISLYLENVGFKQAVKIVVTAGEFVGTNKKCNAYNQTLCEIEDTEICILKIFECDGNFNCGNGLLTDEDSQYCDSSKTNYKALAYGIFTVSVLIILCIRALIHWLPNVADIFFVFGEKEDNTLILSTLYSYEESKWLDRTESLYSFNEKEIKVIDDQSLQQDLSRETIIEEIPLAPTTNEHHPEPEYESVSTIIPYKPHIKSNQKMKMFNSNL